MNCIRLTLIALLASTTLLASGGASADPRGGQTAGQEVGPPVPPEEWLRRLVGKYKFDGLVQVVALGDCGPLPPDPANQETTSEAPPEPYCRTIKGKGDCVAIGTGPGVQCILNVSWQDMYEIVYPTTSEGEVNTDPAGVFELPGGPSYLDPSMALFGIDPGKSEINYLLVDQKGMPEGGLGYVRSNRATFRSECVNESNLLNAMKPVEFNERLPASCNRIIHFDARPDSKVVLITMDIEINDDAFTRITMTMRREATEEKVAAPATTAKPATPAKPASK
jgi:hypothetical protein